MVPFLGHYQLRNGCRPDFLKDFFFHPRRDFPQPTFLLFAMNLTIPLRVRELGSQYEVLLWQREKKFGMLGN